MIFFDFLCFSIYKVYNQAKESGTEFSAGSTVAFLQTLNILIVILIWGIIDGEFYLTKAIGLIILGVFVVINYIRYILRDEFSMDRISDRWNAKSEKYRNDSRLLQTLYVIGSLLGFASLIIYLGIKKTYNL